MQTLYQVASVIVQISYNKQKWFVNSTIIEHVNYLFVIVSGLSFIFLISYVTFYCLVLD